MAAQETAVERPGADLQWRISRVQAIGLLFAIGVLSQNMKLLPVGSEYQPWIYCGVVPFAAWANLRNGARVRQSILLPTLLGCSGFVLLLILAITLAERLPTKDMVRVLSLPMVAAATVLYLREVPQSWVKLVLRIHVVLLFLGVAAPGAATAIAGLFGDRGQGYYQGWNSYVYSEPSYAALAFLFLAFFLSRQGRLAALDAAFLVALLASTLSVTGIFGAIVVVATFIWQRSKALVLVLSAVALAVLLSASLIPSETSSRSFERLSGLVTAAQDVGGTGMSSMLLVLNTVEPSGTWRIASNLYGISCVEDLPLGLGNTDIFEAISRAHCSDFLASVLRENATFRLLGDGASAQSVFANLVMMSGIPGALMGGLLLLLQLFAFRHSYVRQALPLAGMFVLFFVIWQSAWAAPTASLMIAAAFPLKGKT